VVTAIGQPNTIEDRAEKRKHEKIKPTKAKYCTSSLLSLNLLLISAKITGRASVMRKKTCCRLETPASLRSVENTRMKLKQKHTRINMAWLFVKPTCIFHRTSKPTEALIGFR
jgi:hypothetical protein